MKSFHRRTITLRGPLTWLLVAGLSMLVSGCAGTARGIDRSVYQAGPADTQMAIVNYESTAQVVIRYPAMIHAHAESFFVSSFAVNSIGGDVPYTMFAKPQTERMAQSLIAKSSYYAMSLYRELKARLPEQSVLLSPHIILWDEKQQLHSRPILASEQIPSVLTLDFTAYSFPDVNELMESPPLTFGDLVTPLMVVQASPWARPGLNGVLLASEPLLGATWRQQQNLQARRAQARLQGRQADFTSTLDLIAFLAERDAPAVRAPRASPGQSGAGRIAVESYPVEKIQLQASLVEQIEQPDSADPFARDFVRGAATRILDLLQSVEPGRATFFARQAALTRFDPELAEVFFVQSSDESVRSRLQLADALIAAEREFLSAQSDSIYEGTYGGDFGIKMRKIIAAEYRMLQERRGLARKQNLAQAVAALALAGSVYGLTVTTTASAAAVASFSGLSLLGSVWAMNRAMDTRSESEEVNEYFIARMAPTFERQMSVQMEWLESKEVITARGFAEFRNKTLSLYQSRIRSMSVATEEFCVFEQPGSANPGRWYGRCEAGFATGRGYGVVSSDNGDLYEYLGDAREGMAHGTGAEWQHGTRAVYREGAFSQGRADGVLRIEPVGDSPRYRLFQAGTDMGKAGPADWKGLPFAMVHDSGPGIGL